MGKGLLEASPPPYPQSNRYIVSNEYSIGFPDTCQLGSDLSIQHWIELSNIWTTGTWSSTCQNFLTA